MKSDLAFLREKYRELAEENRVLRDKIREKDSKIALLEEQLQLTKCRNETD